MPAYRVDFEAFREALGRAPHLMEGMRDAIGQLIARYDLRGREILCLGSGYAGEEYWLWKLGQNRLTIIDIDIKGDIEPVLRTLPEGDATYIVGDALESPPQKSYDALFMSGFTPDIDARYQVFVSAGYCWPSDADPFHPIVVDLATHLRLGGYLLNLTFGYSFDAKAHPAFLPAMDSQLRRIGMTLIEVHRMTVNTGVMLFVGQAGDCGADLGSSLTRIHGRAPAEPIEQIWPMPPELPETATATGNDRSPQYSGSGTAPS